MSNQAKKLSAADAIVIAKKNSLARKQKVARGLRQLCFEKIGEMVANGVVSVYVPMNEEQHFWGLAIIQKELEDLGYKVILHEDEESETPDLELSIEHLK
jgi:hypothetical protein